MGGLCVGYLKVEWELCFELDSKLCHYKYYLVWYPCFTKKEMK